MFEKIIDFSIRNKPIIGFLVFVLIGFGIYSLSQLSIDAVPDITNNQVQVVTQSPSLSPQEMERFITYPLEITMANIKDVIEIRSVSRYGLSVLTVVFKDNVPILEARQLVNEQIQLAKADIPEELGTPEMLPITTGLGEIYQYTLDVKKGYEGKYSSTDLREIQDWIVKRQLSGIPGIVEISSFGGYFKQYEIAIDPTLLRNHKLTVADVYEAVASNNQNTGGSYIEKNTNAFYIRAEGLLEDIKEIENIVVKSNNGIPVFIKHIGEVKIGAAPRFGAMTKNGQGEAIGGITLMLKGANSSKVINEVKERIKLVETSLPEGITIKPYLDRAAFVAKTTSTVAENLVVGGLIVIFILILLLGNFRSGLIVASVIPLSLLFGFILMNIFNVSANLMSLGAIDFGIVIDGAVIIVENILYQIYQHHHNRQLTQKEIDDEVSKASASIYKSAAFGVIIILIVFIPIITLTGIEGKTFKPLAQVFMFVILGAFILSMTYVPMMSALITNKNVFKKKNLSDKIIKFLKLSYHPVLRYSLANRKTILIITGIVFLISIWSFTKLGGEFIPTLDEGDLAMQMTVPTGSSLSQSIATATKAEKILMDNFPEVEQVISKIGTAEVPTDPMAIEDADIMIILKKRKEWVSAESRDELIDKMKEKLEVITAASFEFTQPIQLRFNELMTGVKTDIAIKIYGEDIDELFDKANEAANIISGLDGAADIRVEQITGLPQLLINYDREKIAKYGLSITELNTIVETSFAGKKAGVFFENDRKFDIVVRLDSSYRKDLDLDRMYVRLDNNTTIPFSEIASLEYYEGPVQISRDDTKRRVTIGINVRNRDVESLVEEIDQELTAKLILNPGYYISYGGQFENLENARKRLKVAVPIALLLILILLFFTFNSIRYALLIFTAVPLSAVGGIAALWIRGLPFSISAGVGFIALFGVAVLNGIVLISYYNELSSQGIANVKYIVVKGACTRLRPVMMTATTDILGFLPMAISTSAGAEVQRPLATVVIGGIISSTLLTLIILPILYMMINERQNKKNNKKLLKSTAVIVLFLLGLSPLSVNAQNQPAFQKLTMQQAVENGLNNNPQLKNAELEIKFAKTEKGEIIDFSPTEFNYQYGEINSSIKDKYWDINQNVGSLITPIYKSKYVKNNIELQTLNYNLAKNRLSAEIKTAYNNWIYSHDRLNLLFEEKNIYSDFIRISELHYKLGETDLLAKTIAQTRFAEVNNKYLQAQEDLSIAENKLKQIIFIEGDLVPETEELVIYEISKNENPDSLNSTLNYYKKNIDVMVAKTQVEKSKFFPTLSAGYFNQEIDGNSGFTGWKAGLTFPLFFFNQNTQISKSKINQEIASNEFYHNQISIKKEIENLKIQLDKYFNQINYYKDNALKQADLLIKTANIKFEKEDIEYFEYLQSISTALEIKLNYIETIKSYNETAIQLEYYLN